ncbi:NAD-dependent epimerase/dehydratase family protein, partial [Alphaproteobacteria bacterium]|nr:NAD-dependent epimerase/dehydratase family protein [Alphaproteobacteria bacterium]
LSDIQKTKNFFNSEKPDYVIHLAAQAGVRNSIENPHSYISSNFSAFLNVLEGCKENKVKHLIYASSSSVYGQSSFPPFSEEQTVDNPENLYAASKKSNELMAYSYANLFNVPCTGLRFFTVYGPWGRPDMAYFKFVKNILENKVIDVYGNGKMYRDFTYIDDIIDGIVKILEKGPSKTIQKNTNNTSAEIPWDIFNIGNNKSVSLEKFIKVIEDTIGKKAKKNYMEMQLGDVYKTSANIDKIKSYVNFTPETSIDAGLPIFVEWFKSFYNVNK